MPVGESQYLAGRLCCLLSARGISYVSSTAARASILGVSRQDILDEKPPSQAGGCSYTSHLVEFYTRSKTSGVEVYGDAYRAIRPIVVDMAAPDSGDCILDMATGGGYQAAEFSASGHRAVGMDYVYDRALLASEQHAHLSAEWGVADMQQLPFADNAFDIVTVSLALHDLPSDLQQAALRELSRVALKRVVVVEPRASDAWLWRHAYALLGELLDESLYIREYLLNHSDDDFDAAGLRVVQWHRCYYRMLAIYVLEPTSEERISQENR